MLFLLTSLKKDASSVPTSSPKICSDTTFSSNSLDCFNNQVSLDGDVNGEILQILDDLLNISEGSKTWSQGIKEQVNESFQNSCNTSDRRLTGYLWSETIFNFNHRVLIGTEIKVLEKGLDFASIQRKINEPELSKILMMFVEECTQNDISGTSHKSLVKLQHFQ